MPSTFKSGSHLTLVFILEQRPEIDVTLLQTKDRVGGKVDLPVPPHHRAYGTVHGGLREPGPDRNLIEQAQETPLRQ